MDSRLIAWGRAVKRRRVGPPPLWFFTDERRAADPLPIISRLPVGLCGVVFRHDTHPDRAALARRVARLCRARKLKLIIAGDARLAAELGAGLHLRGGAVLPGGRGVLRSASAHNAAQMARARRAKVALVFLSPVFPTASHPGANTLGVSGWLKLARQSGQVKPCALGGITGRQAGALGTRCNGVGAINAFF
ncbi:MAG: thiamine phosphate synthase [Rhodospirillales bacterium]|nr:thiamine phosphate synthase [Rhodospirillales bacterium]